MLALIYIVIPPPACQLVPLPAPELLQIINARICMNMPTSIHLYQRAYYFHIERRRCAACARAIVSFTVTALSRPEYRAIIVSGSLLASLRDLSLRLPVYPVVPPPALRTPRASHSSWSGPLSAVYGASTWVDCMDCRRRCENALLAQLGIFQSSFVRDHPREAHAVCSSVTWPNFQQTKHYSFLFPPLLLINRIIANILRLRRQVRL